MPNPWKIFTEISNVQEYCCWGRLHNSRLISREFNPLSASVALI